MDATLIVVGGKANKSEVRLKLPSTIGRSRSADLTVAHPKVSRQHCEIFERDGMLVVRDNGSLNGTLIEDNRISEATILFPGQKLTVGPLTFVAAYEPESTSAELTPTLDLPTPPAQASADSETPPAIPGLDLPDMGLPDFGLDDELPDASANVAGSDSHDDDLLPPPVTGPLPVMPATDCLVPPTVATSQANELLPPTAPSQATAAPQADDFRWLESPDMMETVPVESESADSANLLHMSDSTVNVPSPTVEISEHQRADLTEPPVSQADFQLPSETPDATGSPPTGDDLAWPVEEDVPSASEEASVETISASKFDETVEAPEGIPPIAVETATSPNGSPASTSEPADTALPESPSPVDAKRPSARGWWPFGGKKSSSAKRIAESSAADFPTDPEEAPDLPAERPSLHSAFLPPAAEPEQVSFEPGVNNEPLADDEGETNSPAPSTDEPELNQFLKSLGD